MNDFNCSPLIKDLYSHRQPFGYYIGQSNVITIATLPDDQASYKPCKMLKAKTSWSYKITVTGATQPRGDVILFTF